MKTYWDPVWGQIHENQFNENIKNLEKEYQQYKNNPKKIKKIFIYTIIFSTSVTIILLLILILSKFEINLFLHLGIFILVPFFYHTYYKKFGENILKLSLAKKYNWQFNPQINIEHSLILKRIYPHLLNLNSEGLVYNEFWGKFKNLNFYFSEYSTSKSKTSKNSTIFIFKLNKPIKKNFILKPKQLNRSEKINKKEQIDTESLAFNQTFLIYYNGIKIEQESKIIKILSPAVIVEFLNLNKKYGEFFVEFFNETIIFVFTKDLIKLKYTNLIKNIEVDARDELLINNLLSDLLNISNKIEKYIN